MKNVLGLISALALATSICAPTVATAASECGCYWIVDYDDRGNPISAFWYCPDPNNTCAPEVGG